MTARGDAIYYEECPSCAGRESCGAMHPRAHATCTRIPGHEGAHVACTSRHAAHRWEGEAPRERRAQGSSSRRGEAEARRQALLDSLRRAAVPLGEWSRAHGYQEKEVRGDVGALRRQGHAIRAIGSGRFALEEPRN